TVSEEPAEAGGAAPPVAGGAADGGTAPPAPDSGLEAVVAFYHQRIGLLGPSQFEKLRFWLEEMGMSPDVIALAIEETVQNAKTPRMNYLEAVLRNWYNDGVRTVADLQRSRQSRASALPQRSEGAPNAAAYDSVDPDAVRRWKEMYADEYDG
ncbi:MAG: DnaD domain protein, partial [Limnochordales bacterium]